LQSDPHSGQPQLSIKYKESDKQIVKLSTGTGKLKAEGIFPRRKETTNKQTKETMKKKNPLTKVILSFQ
jgi:hypothetical protein